MNDSPSADRPPVLEISVTNTDDTAHILTIPNKAFPFSTASATADGNSMILENSIPDVREGACWTGHAKRLPMVSGNRLGPGESVAKNYAVLNAPNPAVCWPPGRYEFRETYYIDPRSEDTKQGGTEFDWGFTVVVNEDESVSLPE